MKNEDNKPFTLSAEDRERSREHRKARFKVEARLDTCRPLDKYIEFSVTSNGTSWITIGFENKDEVRQAIEALKPYAD